MKQCQDNGVDASTALHVMEKNQEIYINHGAFSDWRSETEKYEPMAQRISR